MVLVQTLGVCEVDDIVLHEKIDFFNARNCVYTQSLERCLKPLVVCGRYLVHGLLFPAMIQGNRVFVSTVVSERGHHWGLEWGT